VGNQNADGREEAISWRYFLARTRSSGYRRGRTRNHGELSALDHLGNIMKLRLLILVLALFLTAQAGNAPMHYLKKKADWFTGEEAKQIATHILSWQTDLGGWPKNEDTTKLYTGDRAQLKPTFDNSATTDELRFLAHMFAATKDSRYRIAIEEGFDHIIKAQYPNGGWPQYYPPPKSYNRHITFNDGAMVRLMIFLRETYAEDLFKFLDETRRQSARKAFDRGVDCILKCQIKVEGKLTVWCAQHDEVTLDPRPARKYELASLSGAESVGVVRLLMSLDKPNPEIKAAIEGAVAWFENSKLKGVKVVQVGDAKAPSGKDARVVADPAAPPLWARFYEIGMNRPIFCDRDGVAKRQLSEIGYERRNGYGWLGNWPAALLEKDYPAWKAKWAAH
jgi:PelA/Pel-15E family pectate lyase